MLLLIGGSAYASEFDFYASLDSEAVMNSTTNAGGITSSKVGYKSDFLITGNKADAGGTQLLSLGLSLGNNLGVGRRTVALTSLKWEKTAHNYRLKLGDVLESFSQYSLSSSYKGLSFTYILPGNRGLELTFAGGYAYPRWENIYAGDEVVAVAREVKGLKLTSGPSTSGTIYGASIVSSIDKKGITAGDNLYDNLVYAVDAEFIPIPGLTVRSVAAFASTSEKTNNAQFSGNAIRLDASSAAKQGRAVFEYERVSPGFMAVMGSAVADREKVKLRITSNHTKTLTSTVGYLYTRDNLERKKAKTTVSHKPEVKIDLRRPFDRRYADISASVKFDIKRIDGSTVAGNTVSLSYEDRFGPIDTAVTISRSSNGTGRQEMNYLAEVSTRTELGAATLSPVLRFNIITDGNAATANIADTALDLRVDLPSSNINSSIKVGQQRSTTVSANPKKTYADLAVYYRPGYLTGLRDGRISLRANHIGYSYTDASQDRAETSVKIGVSLSW